MTPTIIGEMVQASLAAAFILFLSAVGLTTFRDWLRRRPAERAERTAERARKRGR
jgi:hypothetical protein